MIDQLFNELNIKMQLRVLAHSNAWAPLFARYLPQSHARFVTN